MKKTFLPLFFLFFISGTIFSQGIYLRAGTGYGMPVATSSIGENYTHTYDYSNLSSPNTYSTSVVKASFGAGMNFNFAVGYEFNENFIFDLNIQYLSGMKFETSDVYKDINAGVIGTESSVYTTSSKGFFFNPSFIFSAGFGKAAPYGRFGLVASSPEITEDESYFYDLDGTTINESTWVLNKGISVGYQAAVGMNWKLSEILDLFTEANFVSMTYYPTQGMMTKYNSNGADFLGNLNTYQTQILFEKDFDPQTPYDPGKPRLESRKAYPFSSVSAQVGIRFSLWKKAD
jgi:hypothetical protein